MKQIAVSLLICFLAFSSPRADTLNIDPVRQDMPHWCWAATAEMVFQYYGIAAINPINYQCGIVALSHPICNVSCGACDITAPNVWVLKNVLTKYPMVARNLSWGFGSTITALPSLSPLSASSLRTEIDGGRPVVAGVSPSGFSYNGQPQHATLIVGYEGDGSDLVLVVNDPFPYDLSLFASVTNPYIARGGTLVTPGQYRIGYSAFRRGFQWTQSISKIRCQGSTCP